MKQGRNDLCPCGSGTKYKKCCLPLREKAMLERDAAEANGIDTLDALERLSNGVPDLIKAGHLDEAEAACRELRVRFPDQIDWLERTALLEEARGNWRLSAKFYRRCVTFSRAEEGFDDDSRKDWLDAIARLDALELLS